LFFWEFDMGILLYHFKPGTSFKQGTRRQNARNRNTWWGREIVYTVTCFFLGAILWGPWHNCWHGVQVVHLLRIIISHCTCPSGPLMWPPRNKSCLPLSISRVCCRSIDDTCYPGKWLHSYDSICSHLRILRRNIHHNLEYYSSDECRRIKTGGCSWVEHAVYNNFYGQWSTSCR